MTVTEVLGLGSAAAYITWAAANGHSERSTLSDCFWWYRERQGQSGRFAMDTALTAVLIWLWYHLIVQTRRLKGLDQ